jgi:hypothetical protein
MNQFLQTLLLISVVTCIISSRVDAASGNADHSVIENKNAPEPDYWTVWGAIS